MEAEKEKHTCPVGVVEPEAATKLLAGVVALVVSLFLRAMV